MVRPGISVLLQERPELVAGQRIGIFTNQTGVLPDLASTVDALISVADVRAIFSPEHGLYGAAAAGAEVAADLHHSGVPIWSLYGAHLAPTPVQLNGLDAIVCDIQDIGCRFYTYAWTLVKLMAAAAQANITVIIADRPNPLGGMIEGPSLDREQRSLVGGHDVPIRHGLTLGELAQLVQRELELRCTLVVVPCAGWRRDLGWTATGLPWVPPSPNIPTPESALVYPGTCLLEGANVSVGRGTAKPFEWLGAPWIDGVALAAALNAHLLSGVLWRPLRFQPCAAPYAGETCGGVQLHVVDAAVFRPVAAGLALVTTMYRLYADQWSWDRAHFDRLIGSAHVRAQIELGRSIAELSASWVQDEAEFAKRCAAVRLYA